ILHFLLLFGLFILAKKYLELRAERCLAHSMPDEPPEINLTRQKKEVKKELIMHVKFNLRSLNFFFYIEFKNYNGAF
ncbi:MAG: hypothetical protein ACTSWE_09705, partial [Promethearchaeota archaeon]